VQDLAHSSLPSTQCDVLGPLIFHVLKQRPDREPISLLANNSMVVTFTVCWWLVNYAPYRLPYRVLQLWPVKVGDLIPYESL
jgi:hypothetical protein